MTKDRTQRRGLFSKHAATKTEDQKSEKMCNYLIFEERVKGSIVQPRTLNSALICLNVNNLEFINNVFGLTSGNAAVELLGTMIGNQMKEGQFATSFAAGSYAVFVKYQKTEELETFIKELCVRIADYEYIMQTNYSICVHSGAYLVEEYDKLSVKDMIDRALIALKNCFGFEKQFIIYEESMREKLLLEAEIIKSMDYAIEHDEFKIYLQPQHHLQQDDVVLSAEALVRWVREDGRVIHPGEFIPAFEKNGLISKLDRHVMELACRFIGDHMNEPWCGNISIAVNVSKVDLKQNDFIRYYTEMKNKYHIPDGLIEIEFTESAVFEDYNEFKIIMAELHRNGFSTALDDFGAGSSSLNVLKELPVDVLKMDRLFFTKDESYDCKRDNSVIASVVAMARGLGMKIIAEGIESVEQIDFLRKIGCDVIQGYVYSKPLPVEDFIEYVKNYKPRFIVKPLVPRGIRHLPQMPQNQEALYEKYQIALEYVDAYVAEVDLEEDTIRTIGYGDDTISAISDSENYSTVFDEVTSFLVLSEDRDRIITKCSLSNLLAAFYRGDTRVFCECRGRISDPESGVLTERFEWFEIDVRFSHFADDKSAAAILFVRNIQKKKERELSFVQQEKRLYDVISDIYLTVVELNPKENICRLIKDTDCCVTSYSQGKGKETYANFFNYVTSEGVVHPDDLAAIKKLMDADYLCNAMDYQDDVKVEYRLKTPMGYSWREARILPKGSNYDALCCIQDIDRKKRERYQLNERVLVDRLTRTFNKEGFMDAVTQFLTDNPENGNHALLVVDIDGFREINQSNGHTFGDILLCDFVQCMKRINRKDDVVARISGDEFALFLKDITEENLMIKVERIRSLFRTQAKQDKYDITFCIGIAYYPTHAIEVRELYREAFLALTEAKKMGKDSYCIYSEELGRSRSCVDGGEILSVLNRPFQDKMFSNVFRIMYENSDVKQGVRAILKYVGVQFDLGLAFVEETATNGQNWEEVALWQQDNPADNEKKINTALWANTTFLNAFEQGELFSCNDVDLLPEQVKKEFVKLGITSILLAPAIHDGELCGMVGFAEMGGTRIWLEEEQETLVLLADMLVSSLFTD